METEEEQGKCSLIAATSEPPECFPPHAAYKDDIRKQHVRKSSFRSRYGK